MLQQMERSTIKLLAQRGKSQRQIAKELGRSRTTFARAVQELVDHAPARRHRPSHVDPYRPQIEQWIGEKLTAVRMLELARNDPDHPYTGGRSVFSDMVRRIRLELERASADVPIRFEGLPAEYLQVDWAKYAPFPSRTKRPPHATFSPLASSTAAGIGCASRPTCAKKPYSAALSSACARSTGSRGWWCSTI